MSSEFIYSTTFRLKKGVEEDEKIKRILDNYDKDKYRSVNNLIKKAILELYAIDKQASISKEDIADIIKEAVNDALSGANVILDRGTEDMTSNRVEEEQSEEEKILEDKAEEKDQVGDEVLSFLNSFDDLYDD